MTARPPALLLLVALGCSSTTSANRGSPEAYAWLARRASSDLQVELVPDRPIDRARIAIDARSPTDVRFAVSNATVVPLEQVGKVVEVHHGLGALDGAAIGLGVGALSGLLYGALRPLSGFEQSMDCTLVCNHADAAELYAIVFGALGLVAGTATGAIVGARDVLDLR
jgi:hypothetical protein